ncbi:MFS transporter [Coraliomargarita sp. SDUM461004]|uniref:MFS transporter n=1 Tax=Thalassobacterium sedimentorum TaxID=3041258 RepID=A0ABU1AMV6_9BACT|nr:MFS transporter [Coraliomargarita sp. SDUM461004]MDQ8196121.1 MFS transporter [Coraliomargarita sp. SDUM461004]
MQTNETKNEHHETKPSERVPVPKRIAFGSGLIAYALMNNGFATMLNPIFNVNFGVNPAMLGWVTAISRFYDAFTDPIMGSISDNTRSRMGRRRPYIALGALLGAIFFALIWWAPRGEAESFYVWWVLGGSIALSTAFTIFSVPYIALSFEMTPDYHERTRVMAYKVSMGMIGGVMVGSFFWLTQRAIFSDTIEGMRYVGIAAGVVIFLVALIPTFFAKEHPDAERSSQQAKVSFFKSVRATLSVKPFQLLIAITVVLLFSLQLVGQLGFYVNLYHVYDGDQAASANVHFVAMTSYQVFAFCAIPLVTKLATRVGKRQALILFLIFAMVGSVSKWFCYSQAYPYLQIIPNALMGSGLAATWLLLNAMIPDAVDFDEVSTGTRREGMFSAVYSWMFKVGIGLALIGAGYVLNLTGFDVNLETSQSPETLYWMRVLFTLLPVIGITLAILLLLRYPLTEERSYELRKQLEQLRLDRGQSS